MKSADASYPASRACRFARRGRRRVRRFAAALEQAIAAAERYPSALARFGMRTGLRAARVRR